MLSQLKTGTKVMAGFALAIAVTLIVGLVGLRGIDSTSHGLETVGDGNLALNTNPMPDGRIEPRQVESFRKIGEWLSRYGESIYGTRGGPFVAPGAGAVQAHGGSFALPGGAWWGAWGGPNAR